LCVKKENLCWETVSNIRQVQFRKKREKNNKKNQRKLKEKEVQKVKKKIIGISCKRIKKISD
jgi:hypothetical protein